MCTSTAPHDFRTLYPNIPPGSEQRTTCNKQHFNLHHPRIHFNISPTPFGNSPLQSCENFCFPNVNLGIWLIRGEMSFRVYVFLTLSDSQSSRFLARGWTWVSLRGEIQYDTSYHIIQHSLNRQMWKNHENKEERRRNSEVRKSQTFGAGVDVQQKISWRTMRDRDWLRWN